MVSFLLCVLVVFKSSVVYANFCTKFYVHFSLAVHPNKLLIATGQTAGHDRRDARVSVGIG